MPIRLVLSLMLVLAGQTSIAAMTSDAQGNIYVAGSASPPDLPVLFAAQPQFGESQLMRSVDRGTTWTKLTAPPAAPPWIQPDPALA